MLHVDHNSSLGLLMEKYKPLAIAVNSLIFTVSITYLIAVAIQILGIKMFKPFSRLVDSLKQFLKEIVSAFDIENEIRDHKLNNFIGKPCIVYKEGHRKPLIGVLDSVESCRVNSGLKIKLLDFSTTGTPVIVTCVWYTVFEFNEENLTRICNGQMALGEFVVWKSTVPHDPCSTVPNYQVTMPEVEFVEFERIKERLKLNFYTYIKHENKSG